MRVDGWNRTLLRWLIVALAAGASDALAQPLGANLTGGLPPTAIPVIQPGWFVPGTAIQPGPDAPHFDFDRWIEAGAPQIVPGSSWSPTAGIIAPPLSDSWSLQLLPGGLVYKSYLAGTKESRLSGMLHYEQEGVALLDGVLGARVGLLRFGSRDPWWPAGFQIDVEGSAQVRLDVSDEVDVRATDYRAGVPLTYGIGRHRTKLAYYHLSSHLGDEFLLKFPDFPRLNFSRDAFVLGHTIYLRPSTSIYAEVGWAFHTDVSKPWEFQFGLDHAPPLPTGFRGAPFFAINGHLREELNFGGALTAQAGWSWRSANHGQLLRTGLHFYNGYSNQFSFFQQHERQVGLGIWYDF